MCFIRACSADFLDGGFMSGMRWGVGGGGGGGGGEGGDAHQAGSIDGDPTPYANKKDHPSQPHS